MYNVALTLSLKQLSLCCFRSTTNLERNTDYGDDSADLQLTNADSPGALNTSLQQVDTSSKNCAEDSETQLPIQTQAKRSRGDSPNDMECGTRKRLSKDKSIMATYMVKLHEEMKERAAQRNEVMNKLIKTEEDHVDVFFKSIAMSVKALPKSFINHAKLKTLQLLSELEDAASSTYQSAPYLSTPTVSSYTHYSDHATNSPQTFNYISMDSSASSEQNMSDPHHCTPEVNSVNTG